MKGQLEFLSSRGHRITLVCGGSKEQLKKLRSRNVGKVHYIPFSREVNLISDIKCLIKLWFFFINNRFDSVIFSTPKALLLASIATFFSSSRNRICMFRGRAYENFKGFKYRLFWMFDRLSIWLASEVIFISKSLQDEYIEGGLIKSHKSLTVGQGSSNGIDLDGLYSNNFSDSVELIKKDINYNENDFIVVFLGRHCKDKGIEEWKRVINLTQAKNVKFVSAGVIEDDCARKIVSSLDNSDNYYYVGHLDSVYSLLSIANIHLFLSHREGFGNVAIESAALGVVTLGFDIVGVRDSVSEVSGKLFEYLDVESIAKEICYLSQGDSLSREFDQDAMKQWVTDNFDQELVWEEYEKIY